MYSLVLMTALTAAPETAEFNGFFRRLFSFGGCQGSCDGKGTGCYGSGYGCTGSRPRMFAGSSCHGSCTGSGYGCTGSAARSAGCSGSSYSCMGSANFSCTGGAMSSYSCTGGAMNSYFPPADPGSGCFGSQLSSPTMIGDPFGGMPVGPPMTYPGADGVRPAVPQPAEPPTVVPDSRSLRPYLSYATPTGAGLGRGTVVVRLPADAELYAEGRRLALASGERTFVTPPLPSDQTYTYTFRAEYTRDGETLSRTKRVEVRAGATTTLEFAENGLAKATPPAPAALPAVPPAARPVQVTADLTGKTTPVAAKPAAVPADKPERARITVKLTPGATLFVDGRKVDGAGAVREFSTPPVPPGKEFAYLMRAERTVNGLPDSVETKVTFRAGEIVPTVDFTQFADARR